MRVLLVEGDLRNPSLARLLGVPANNGLIETLKGNEDWRDAIIVTILQLSSIS